MQLQNLKKDIQEALKETEEATSIVVVSSDGVSAWNDGKEVRLDIRPDNFVEELLRRDGYHIVVVKK